MRLALGSDHAGFEAKQALSAYLKTAGHVIDDSGCFSTESCDYPDFAFAVGKAVVNQEVDFGILICGTGVGMSITANKIEGIRAALCTSTTHAQLSREHNDANILCMGARLQTKDEMELITKVFLETSFSGGRHARRVEKIHELTGH